MASARSTVSIARTTPAQKPRGEHSITFSCGLSGTWEAGADAISVFRVRLCSVRREAAPVGFGFSPASLSSMRAAETQNFHCHADAQALGRGAIRVVAGPEFVPLAQYLPNIGLRKPVP